jgi:hypothetical protein
MYTSHVHTPPISLGGIFFFRSVVIRKIITYLRSLTKTKVMKKKMIITSDDLKKGFTVETITKLLNCDYGAKKVSGVIIDGDTIYHNQEIVLVSDEDHRNVSIGIRVNIDELVEDRRYDTVEDDL